MSEEQPKQKVPWTWKEYYAANKDKITERNKVYRTKYAEKLREERKQYWVDNQDKIKMRRKEIVECPLCNVNVTRESFSRHIKSKTHISKIHINENMEELKSKEDI